MEGFDPTEHKVIRTVAVPVNKAEVTAPAISSKIYTGTVQTADVAENTLYSVKTNAGGIYAGTYDVVLSLTDADNYKWSSVDSADCTLSFEITKNTTNKVTVSIESWTYGEAVNAPSSTADFGAQNVVYSYSNKENGTYTADVPATVGTWWVKATVPETADYAGGMACTSFSINTRPLTITTGSAEKDYDGTPLTKDGYKISETGLAIGDEIVEGSIKVTGSQT